MPSQAPGVNRSNLPPPGYAGRMALEARSDAEIIATSRARPQAFEVVFDRHFDAIVRYATGRVGAANAADVAGEVFVRAFGLRARFDGRHPSALPWLYGIAANVCREHVRKAARRRRAILRHGSAADAIATGFEVEAVARVGAGARRQDLEAALRFLSDDEYAVLMLAAIGGVTYQEMADHLQVPVGTVRSRLSRARRRVRELLEVVRPIQDGSDPDLDVAVEPTP